MAFEHPSTDAGRLLRRSLGEDALDVTLHEKTDIVDNNLDSVKSDVENATYGLGALKTAITAVNDDTDNIQSSLADGTNGLAAIKTAVGGVQTTADNIEDKVDTAQLDITSIKNTAEAIAADVGDFTGASTTLKDEIAAVKNIVTGINNASGNFSVLLEEQLELPDSGYRDYVYTVTHRVNGIMTSLDAAPTATLSYTDGTSANSLLFNDAATPVASLSATLKSTGYYKGRIRITAGSTAVGPMQFDVTGLYTPAGGSQQTLIFPQGLRVDEAFTLSWNTTDAQNLVDAKAAAEAAETLAGTIDGKVDGINTELDTIRETTAGTFDRDTDSLQAIREAMDAYLSGGTLPIIIEATRTSGSIAASGNELVVIGVAHGFDCINCNLKLIEVIPANSAANFKVEVFEKSDETSRVFNEPSARGSRGDLSAQTDILFLNKNASPSKNIYVKITAAVGAPTTTYAVKIRAIKCA